MATVHFGRLTGHAGFAREVAIKRLHRHLASDPEFVGMLLDEARLAARVVHANVVPTLDVVAEGADVFVIMEYVRGLPLSQVLKTLHQRGERMPPRVASAIVSGMLHGLHAAHEATDDRGVRLEIVHRDVSPHNVLVGIDGVPRLIDFGIAKAEIRLQTTQDGRVKGKFAYMAPEQAEGENVTRRTDVYAAGVVLWEVLTGEHLHRGANELNVILRLMHEKVTPPSNLRPELPRGLDGIVAKAMARNADDRYESARAMAIDLDRCLEGASAAEIGRWLEQVGGEALLERSKRIAELERAAADLEPSSGPSSAGRARAPTDEVPRSATRMSARPRDQLTTIAEIATPLSVASTERHEAPSPRGPAWVSLTLAGGVGAAFLLVLVLVVSRINVADRLVAMPSPSSSALRGLPPIASAAPPAEDDHATSAPGDTTGGSASLPVAPGAGGSADPSHHESSVPPPTPAPPGAVRHHRHPAACVPSTVDSAGHTHFNPACL
jgi:serine/threonine-protein kinase